MSIKGATTAELSPAERYDLAQKKIRELYDALIAAKKELREARDVLEVEMRQEMVRGITKREEEVLLLVKENLSNKEIACKLNIGERTIKFHMSNLLNKFGVQSRHELF